MNPKISHLLTNPFFFLFESSFASAAVKHLDSMSDI